MAALDIKWSFKEDFIQIKGEKIPLVKSGKNRTPWNRRKDRKE